MQSDLAIRIQKISKRYRIYPTPSDRLRDALGWSAKFKEFDALKNVSFDVRNGEFWGILGRNGSGKSTLLKIVAGLLQPTNGSIESASKITLLQLGLGFDPELTGIANIRQSRMLQDLAVDLDQVESFVRDFSELGDFINYPVKTYSSGMNSRLAFATAVAGDPDILIADEVLAVGDMNFAQKCLAKMREFKDKGKTVILVTHDINAVKTYCDLALWLHEGAVNALGEAKMVAEEYRNFMLYGARSELATLSPAPSTEAATRTSFTTAPTAGWIKPNLGRQTVSAAKVRIDSYAFIDHQSGGATAKLEPGRQVEVRIRFEIRQEIFIHSFAFTLHDKRGLIAIHLNSGFFGDVPRTWLSGELGTAKFNFDVPPLAAGNYSISLGCSEGHDGVLVEKFDYDSAISLVWPESKVTERQGGYLVVPQGAFEYSTKADE